MSKTKLPISDKEKIRKEVKRRISLLSEKEKKKAAKVICRKLFDLVAVQKSVNIIIYQALEDEMSLNYFIREAHKQYKNIITITTSGSYVDLPEEWIILVPGRAFTLSGKRIGRGGGWYDRFLEEYPKLYKIGVCFDCQIFPDLPQEEHDISMNEIITGATK